MPTEKTPPGIPANAWQPLMDRLVADGFKKNDIEAIFSGMEETVSLLPMGAKAWELYRLRFLRPAPSPQTTAPKRPAIYKGILTRANLEKARLFMKENRPWLDRTARESGVPPEVLVSLLLVETRLGAFLGRENAFSTLASMASSHRLEPLLPFLKGHTPTEEEKAWLEAAIIKKAEWAYLELKALLEYTLENNISPISIPGSVYGAIGLCQFMPSNIKRYGRDGNGNNQINLFSPPDAIASVGSYLKAHGWKAALTRSQRAQVLKKYNNSTMYANTILAVAEQLAPGTKPQAATKTKKQKSATTGAKKKQKKTRTRQTG